MSGIKATDIRRSQKRYASGVGLRGRGLKTYREGGQVERVQPTMGERENTLPAGEQQERSNGEPMDV